MKRIIYSLEFDLGPDIDGSLISLVAPLKSNGQSSYIRPERKRRAVDLRVGDHLRHKGERFRVEAIRAYRENVVPDGWQGEDGWVTG